MSGRTCEKLVNMPCGSPEKRVAHFQKAIPVKKRVAICSLKFSQCKLSYNNK